MLKQLKNINNSSEDVHLPFFEKSLFNGEGDRVEGGSGIVRPPIDVILFEGWCVGFCPVQEEEIDKIYEDPVPDLTGILDIKSFRKEDIKQINNFLWDYVEWWSFIDVFIQVGHLPARGTH